MSRGKTGLGREVDMLSGPLVKNILIFALPLAVTGILQQLFNAADVAVVGRFVGKNAMAAVGSNSPVVGLIVNLFVGVSLGANVVIAKLTGMQEQNGIHRAVDISLLMALAGGLAATALGEALAVPVLKLIAVPAEVFPMAEAYLRIYLLGLPVILLFNFESAIFRSQGDSVTPLICLTASGLVNVGLNLFFVIVVGMTTDGVALATVISNAISAGILFWILTHSDRAISIHRHKLEIDRKLLREIVRIGLPAGLQSALFSISNICIQSAVNGLGTDVMAASAAAFNLEVIVYYVVNAFGQACTTFTGQNAGAGNPQRCRMVMWRSLLLDEIFTAVFSGGILLAGVPLLRVFNTDPVVVGFGMIRLRYLLYAEVVNAVIEILSGAMRGYGWSLEPALLTLIGVCGVRITWVFTVFPLKRTYPILLWSYPISWLITAAALAVAYAVKITRKKRNESGLPAER